MLCMFVFFLCAHEQQGFEMIVSASVSTAARVVIASDVVKTRLGSAGVRGRSAPSGCIAQF